MPYSSNRDLPKAVRDNLPEHAQTIWRAAYNEASKRDENDTENAARVAWAAVKNKYKQGPDGKWVRKELSSAELAEMVKLARIPVWMRGKIMDQLAKVKELVDYDEDYVAKREFTPEQRRRLASTGAAMPDGSFPIENCGDVSNAVQAIGRAAEGKRAAVKAHILKRARALGCSVPEDWAKSVEPVDRSQALEQEVYKQEGKVDMAYRIVKAEDERRYTLGPVYSPNSVDAHGEAVTPEDLQEAMWDYVAKGDRTVRLQHSKERAGEWVELMTWPTDLKTTMTKADGSVGEIEFPAGTVFMGVRWDQDVWPLVKSGRLTGYSMGGRATRVEVEEQQD